MGSVVRSLVRFLLVAAVSSPLLLSGCSMLMFLANPPKQGTDAGTGVQSISVAQTVTLAWDPPAGDVSSYKVFCREHGASTWSLLAEIPAQTDPAITLHQADFGNGSFDFGVEALADTGAESPMHTSLDATAQPASGWYLTWEL
jgi:hypothetical protein